MTDGRILLCCLISIFVGVKSFADAPTRDMMAKGTNSGGGGNLLRGKPIEKYIFDFKKSPEYALLNPTILQIQRYLPGLFRDMRHVMIEKAWYKIPTSLKALPSGAIGTPFESTQAAVQTINGVWISDPSYQPMPLEDKALLQWHELLVGLRYGHLNGGYILCQTNVAARNAATCVGVRESPLRPQDYDQIRKASAQLMKLKSPDAKSIAEIFYFNGFKIGTDDIRDTSSSFKNLDFPALRNLLTTLGAQKMIPAKGHVISQMSSASRLNVHIHADIKNGNSDEQFLLTLTVPTLGLQKSYRGFNEVTYIDETQSQNSVYYMVSGSRKARTPGDVIPCMLIEFRGATLKSLAIYEEILKFDPATNTNVWERSTVDATGAPSILFTLE